MPFVVVCKACGSKFQAPDHLAGKRAKCPKCSALIDLASPAPAAAPIPSPMADPSLTAGERLQRCPDCGKMVSRRAQQCPACGCPVVGADSPGLASGPAMARPLASASRSSQGNEGEQPSRKLLLAAVGGIVALCTVAALVFFVVNMLSRPAPVAAQPAPAGPKVSPEQKEAWIQEVARLRADDVDHLYLQLHSAKTMITSTQQTADLLKTLANTGDFPKPAASGTAQTPQAQPYQSQAAALAKECAEYLRKSLPSGDYSRDNVLEVGERWLRAKESPVLAELDQFAKQQSAVLGGDLPIGPSANPPVPAPTGQPASPQAAPAAGVPSPQPASPQ